MSSSRKKTVFVLGQSGSGKTTLCHTLQKGDSFNFHPEPNVGADFTYVTQGNSILTFWDQSGSGGYSTLIEKYLRSSPAEAMIYVVKRSAAPTPTIESDIATLKKILSNIKADSMPVFVVFNSFHASLTESELAVIKDFLFQMRSAHTNPFSAYAISAQAKLGVDDLLEGLGKLENSLTAVAVVPTPQLQGQNANQAEEHKSSPNDAALMKKVAELKKKLDEEMVEYQPHKKIIKSLFLGKILQNCSQANENKLTNTNKSLAECVKEILSQAAPEDRPQVIDGSFSRVRGLMVKILGKSEVATLFAKPKLQKKDASSLHGDAYFVARIENLTIDLHNELHSFWPCAHKERKKEKYDLLKELLAYYSECKPGNHDIKLIDCCVEWEASLSLNLQTILRAGKHSRVQSLLEDLGKSHLSPESFIIA